MHGCIYYMLEICIQRTDNKQRRRFKEVILLFFALTNTHGDETFEVSFLPFVDACLFASLFHIHAPPSSSARTRQHIEAAISSPSKEQTSTTCFPWPTAATLAISSRLIAARSTRTSTR